MTTDAFPALSLVPKTDVEMKAKDFKTALIMNIWKDWLNLSCLLI